MEDLNGITALLRQHLADNPATRYGIQASVAHYLLEHPQPTSLATAMQMANELIAFVVGG
jgi:hypothetical protein